MKSKKSGWKNLASKTNFRQKNTQLIFLCASLTVFVIMTGLFVYNSVKTNRTIQNDELRFSEADQKKKLVFGQLLEKIGAPPIAEDEKNICYNSSQGTYDSGELWCQVASVAYFPLVTPEAQIKSYFEEILKTSDARPQGESGLSFEGSKDLPCKLMVYNEGLAKNTPFYFSNMPGSKQTLVLICVDQAKNKHYPFVN